MESVEIEVHLEMLDSQSYGQIQSRKNKRLRSDLESQGSIHATSGPAMCQRAMKSEVESSEIKAAFIKYGRGGQMK